MANRANGLPYESSCVCGNWYFDKGALVILTKWRNGFCLPPLWEVAYFKYSLIGKALHQYPMTAPLYSSIPLQDDSLLQIASLLLDNQEGMYTIRIALQKSLYPIAYR